MRKVVAEVTNVGSSEQDKRVTAQEKVLLIKSTKAITVEI
jgi:hypothetical protein